MSKNVDSLNSIFSAFAARERAIDTALACIGCCSDDRSMRVRDPLLWRNSLQRWNGSRLAGIAVLVVVVEAKRRRAAAVALCWQSERLRSPGTGFRSQQSLHESGAERLR